MATLLAYALTNVADVKETLGIASSDLSWDNLIIRKINQVTRQIEAFCGRRFLLTTYTDEEYNGTGVDQIVLKNRPIEGTVALSYRNTSLDDNDFTTVESDLMFVNASAGVLNLDFRAIGRWGRYKVTYQAGYATIPEDLAEAATALAAYYVLNPGGDAVGISEKQEGQRSIKYDNRIALSFDSLMSQLGVDGIIDSYANYPVNADK